MLSLSLPHYNDANKLPSICSKSPFVGTEADWKAAYSDYVKHNGDPWSVIPATFAKSLEEDLRGLYKSRKGSGDLQRLRRTKYTCCPMCGSGATGTLDHYLPKEDFSEFSIFTSNLVPTCGACNSGSKGQTYKGTTNGQRFLHPYFDTLAANPIWMVDVSGPYSAPIFIPKQMGGLSPQQQLLVTFHLTNILGWQFHNQMETRWALMPDAIRAIRHIQGSATPKEAEHLISKLYHLELATAGLNSWFAALYRGILAAPPAVSYLASLI